MQPQSIAHAIKNFCEMICNYLAEKRGVHMHPPCTPPAYGPEWACNSLQNHTHASYHSNVSSTPNCGIVIEVIEGH